MLKRGYLSSTIIFVSHAHTKKGCDQFLNDLSKVLGEISLGIKSNKLKRMLDDEVCHSGFARLN